METLLVIGVEGVVGANLAGTLADHFHVIGLSRQGSIHVGGCVVQECPTSDEGLTRSILQTSPAWIVHCGPLAQASWDEPREPAHRLAREPQVVATVAAAAQRLGSALTVISTDAVFAGPRLYHAESSPRDGVGRLAEAARATEEALSGTNALIVRTHAYGWGVIAGETNYAERYWDALNSGISPSTDPHRHATPILASDLAELLHEAYRAGLHGAYHIGGGERTNPRRFLSELAAAFGLIAGPCLEESPSAELPDAPIQETSLVSRRIRDRVGQPLPMLREGLARFAAQAENGYRERLQGAMEPVLQANAA